MGYFLLESDGERYDDPGYRQRSHHPAGSGNDAAQTLPGPKNHLNRDGNGDILLRLALVSDYNHSHGLEHGCFHPNGPNERLLPNLADHSCGRTVPAPELWRQNGFERRISPQHPVDANFGLLEPGPPLVHNLGRGKQQLNHRLNLPLHRSCRPELNGGGHRNPAEYQHLSVRRDFVLNHSKHSRGLRPGRQPNHPGQQRTEFDRAGLRPRRQTAVQPLEHRLGLLINREQLGLRLRQRHAAEPRSGQLLPDCRQHPRSGQLHFPDDLFQGHSQHNVRR